MRTKKVIAVAGAMLAFCAGGALPVGTPGDDGSAVASVMGCAAAEAAESVEEAWREDINEATRDDTMAFGVYIGKPLQAYIDDFTSKGWTRKNIGDAVSFVKKKGDYIVTLVVHPYGESKNLPRGSRQAGSGQS